VLTRPIPDDAMPVVEELRKCAKPKNFPHLHVAREGQKCLRWRNPDGTSPLCPMGLHPRSMDATPFTSIDFLGFNKISGEAVRSFGAWWDEQEDAQEAVKAVWGTVKPRGVFS